MQTSLGSSTQNHFWIIETSLSSYASTGSGSIVLVWVSWQTSLGRLFNPYIRGPHLFILTLEHLATFSPATKVTQWRFCGDSIHSRRFLGYPNPKTGLVCANPDFHLPRYPPRVPRFLLSHVLLC
jgi:hypothetical protein